MNVEPLECYLCGATDNLTKDHVPPKALFPRPMPSNLTTLPCCYSCNNGLHEQDEALRLFTSLAINRNKQGKRIWDGRVMPRTVERGRLRQLRNEMAESAVDQIIATPQGVIEGTFATIPQHKIYDCLVRITKAYLYLNAPSFPRNIPEYRVQQMNQFKLNEYMGALAPVMKWNDELGDGVFRYWGGLADDSEHGGMWILMFYDAAAFAVFHNTAENWSNQ